MFENEKNTTFYQEKTELKRIERRFDLDGGRDGTRGAHDLDLEWVSSLLHGAVLLVASLNGEVGGEGVEVAGFETRTVGDRVGSISSWKRSENNAVRKDATE